MWPGLGGLGGGDEKWLGSGYVLKVRPTGFVRDQMWVRRGRQESRMTLSLGPSKYHWQTHECIVSTFPESFFLNIFIGI